MGRLPVDAGAFIGKKYNYLTIVSDLGLRKNKSGTQNQPYVKVICECGVEKERALTHVVNSIFKSCGCKRGQGKDKIKHGMSGRNGHPLYAVWATIKTRCYNENHPSYRMWGAKGVGMCRAWKNDFITFYNWCIDNGWKPGMQIDKDIKSKNGHRKLYSPETCSIVTGIENLKHRKFKNKIR